MAEPRDDLALHWEWGGVPSRRVIMRLEGLTAEGGGLFGLKRSPSFAGYLPDAQMLTGHVTQAEGDAAGRRLVLRIPKRELPADIRVGDDVALGYTEAGACLCIAKAPASADAIWLKNWQCGHK